MSKESGRSREHQKTTLLEGGLLAGGALLALEIIERLPILLPPGTTQEIENVYTQAITCVKFVSAAATVGLGGPGLIQKISQHSSKE